MLLYYITDRKQLPGSPFEQRSRLLEKIAEAAVCGVDLIQLRERDLPAGELELLARDALAAVRDGNGAAGPGTGRTRLLINSRSDVALATGCDGVHLRGEDVPVLQAHEVARLARARGSDVAHPWIVAASCHSVKEVRRAAREKAAFAVIAPVFEKPGVGASGAAGLDALRQACHCQIPVVALGGVTLDNAALCAASGAAGIAGIRLFQENEISRVVAVIRRLVSG